MPKPNNKRDPMAMSSMTMATEIRSLEEVRKGQVNAAGLLWELCPGDPDEMVEMLKMLGLYGKTGLEVYHPDGSLINPEARKPG